MYPPYASDKAMKTNDFSHDRLQRLALIIGAVFWFAHFTLMLVRGGAKVPEELLAYAGSRLSLSVIVSAICIALLLLLAKLGKRSLSAILTVAIGLTAVAALISAFINLYGFGGEAIAPDIEGQTAQLVHAFMYWFWFQLSAAGAFVAIQFSWIAREEAERSAQAAREAHAAKLLALHYKIGPHFLFNALNSVAGLAEEDPPRAEKLVVDLSGLLRETLELNPEKAIALSQEISLALQYLEIEKVRYPERLSIVSELDETCLDLKVPPLILQPLVENAITHGVRKETGYFTVGVSVATVGEQVCITVSNSPRVPVSPSQASRSVGSGIDNVRARLEASYGTQATLDTDQDSHSFRSVVSIPLHPSTTLGVPAYTD